MLLIWNLDVRVLAVLMQCLRSKSPQYRLFCATKFIVGTFNLDPKFGSQFEMHFLSAFRDRISEIRCLFGMSVVVDYSRLSKIQGTFAFFCVYPPGLPTRKSWIRQLEVRSQSGVLEFLSWSRFDLVDGKSILSVFIRLHRHHWEILGKNFFSKNFLQRSFENWTTIG